jgi:hypothetical protein
MQDFKRGWAYVGENGKVIGACANCGLFGSCDKYPHFSNRMCSDGKRLEPADIEEDMARVAAR